jgi:hypothetical protein
LHSQQGNETVVNLCKFIAIHRAMMEIHDINPFRHDVLNVKMDNNKQSFYLTGSLIISPFERTALLIIFLSQLVLGIAQVTEPEAAGIVF